MSRTKKFQNLCANQRIVLAIDTSDKAEAENLTQIAHGNGARFVKYGLELATAFGWDYCAGLAKKYDVEWIADAKIDDIPATTSKTIKNLLLKNPAPFGITVHSKSGVESMRIAQETAGTCVVFCVTELTAISDQEVRDRYGLSRTKLVKMLATQVAESGSLGIVVSVNEVQNIKFGNTTRHLLALVPGSRSRGAEVHDQRNVLTPAQTIKNGADLIVVGRQVTLADNQNEAYKDILGELS